MSHPTVEQALTGGFYHIDSGGFDVIVDTGSDRASTVDTKNAERDMSSHVAWGVGCFEALETAYALLDLIVPQTAPGVDRRAAAAIIASTMMVDDAMHAEHDYDPNAREVCGRTIRQLGIDMVAQKGDPDYTEYIQGAVALNHLRQYETITARRVPHWKAPDSLNDFMRWRNREGQFFGALLVYLTVGGADVRDVPRSAMQHAIIGTITNYDVHGHYRHTSEHEVGDTPLFMTTGKHHDRIMDALRVVRAHYDAILARDDVSTAAKMIMTRVILVAGECNYLAERWWKSSSVHVTVTCDDDQRWTHTALARARKAANITDTALTHGAE